MKKALKYAGITAATLLMVAPVAAPVINSATEITVKADELSDIQNSGDVQKWTNEINDKIVMTPTSAPITNDDTSVVYVMGSDGVFQLAPKDLTPETDLFGVFSEDNHNTDEFFMHFNNNSNHDDLFFNNDKVFVTMTATDNDGSSTSNLYPGRINGLLSVKNGKGVTFHLVLHYGDAYGHGDGTTTLATKDVVVLPVQSDTNNDSKYDVQDTHGVVKTNNDKSAYKLVNDDNVESTTRALAKDTGWQFDKIRTDKSGNVQYHVSSHEWINASDVTVQSQDNNTNNNNNDTNNTTSYPSGWVVIKYDDTTVINLDKSKAAYALYNTDGGKSTTRSLAGGTSWQVDKVATDAQGNTYLGVSTNEFVKVDSNVTFAK